MAQDPQVIELLTDPQGAFVHSEAIADAASAIVPGMLVEELAAGTVQEHSVGSGNAQKLFALSNLPVAATIDAVYAVGASVRYGAAHAGQQAYALLAIAAAAVVKGAPLESAGDGTLRNQTVAAAAALTIAGVDSDGDLTFTAVTAGADGNDIQIVIETPTATPSVVVEGNTITITPDDTTPTATEVVAQMVASVAASNMVTTVAPGTGASVPGTDAGSNLLGGTDLGANVVAYALEAVDNSAGGSTARIRVRVA